MYPPTIKIEFIVSLKHFEIIPFGFGCVSVMLCVFDGSFFDNTNTDLDSKNNVINMDNF